MNIRALENFISMPCASSNSGKASLSCVVFLTDIEEKRSRSNTGEQFCLTLIFSLLFKA